MFTRMHEMYAKHEDKEYWHAQTGMLSTQLSPATHSI